MQKSDSRALGGDRGSASKDDYQGKYPPEPVPAAWKSSLTYPRKAVGFIGLCLDSVDLNRAIIHEHHKAPMLE